MTEKQERFCVLYVTGGPEWIGNGSACYRNVFNPKTATAKSINERASRLLANRKIQARLKVLRDNVADAACITQGEVMKIAAHMARATLADFYDEASKFKLPSEWTEEMKHAAALMRDFDENGFPRELKLCDKNAAVERWFKHFGLYEKDNKQKGDPIKELLAAIAARQETSKLTFKKKPVG